MSQVVVGLGNPGPEYHDTRHNIGQRVVDVLVARLHEAWRREHAPVACVVGAGRRPTSVTRWAAGAYA